MAGDPTAAEQLAIAAGGDAQPTVDMRHLSDEDRRIDAGWLATWLAQRDASSSVKIIGATIGPGPLELANLVLPRLLAFEACTLPQVELDSSSAGVLLFRFSKIGGVSADSLRAQRLSFAGSVIEGPVTLRTAQIDDQLIASGARIVPTASDARALNCYGIRVGSSVVLWRHERTGRRTRIDGMVDFGDAEIGARFTLAGAVVNCPERVAISLAQARVGGSVILDDARVRGQVRLPLARISGELSATACHISAGLDRVAVAATRIEAGTVSFERASVAGMLDFTGACSRGDLSIADGSLQAEWGSRYALRADLATISGSFRLSGSVEGETRLSHMSVNGDIDLRDCTIRHVPQALTADSVRVQGRLRLSPSFEATGTVVLLAAQIRDIDAAGAHFSAPEVSPERPVEDPAAELDRVDIVNDISFAGAVIRGRILARDARIGGALDCDRVQIKVLDPVNHPTLDLENATIVGNLLMRNATLTGGFKAPALDVSLLYIGHGTRIERPGGVALGLLHVNVRKRLTLGTLALKGAIDLSHARAADLDDRKESWSDAEYVNLDGFEYSALGSPAGRADDGSVSADGNPGRKPDGRRLTAEERLKWLKETRGNQPFRPGPYDRLASVYRSLGEPERAIDVLIERENERLEADISPGPIAALRRTGRRLLKHTVQHGYRPGRAIWALLLTICALSLLVAFGPNHHDVFVANVAGRPRGDLNPLVYAADTVLPIIDLDQASAWRADAVQPWASLYRVAIWTSVLIGWILSSLLVAAVTTVARTDR